MINISQALIENESLVNKLTNNYINKSLPHSLIIHGVKGIGKLTFTFFLIKNRKIYNHYCIPCNIFFWSTGEPGPGRQLGTRKV